ncbi:MAG: metallophosphoesterase [Deltaproteobacteria bacterium]|nr:metallophosphoesterase [Deltaproteobacteria bacterium]
MIALALVVACNKDKAPTPAPTPPAPAPARAPAPAPAQPASSCKLDPLPLRRPAPKRLVAIGDLHGDLAAARAALRTAGAIDASDRWIGGDLVVVQTGDVLDRGGDEQAIMDLLFRLEGEAAAAGGALIMLLGNHELMNGALDFRYVPPEGFADFDDVPGLDLARWKDVPAQARGRVAALAPGGPYAKQLARHDVVAIVGDTVLSHAGPAGEWVDHLDEANRSARCWLDGQAGDFQQRPAVLTSDDSPVWTRAYGMPEADCAAARAALAALGAKRLVVGHTVQPSGITSACDGTVWRIDVGLAKHYGGPIQVLEITASGAKILSGERR